MAEKLTQQHKELAIGKTPLGEDVLLLISMSGTEQLGRLFEYKLELASENHQIKSDSIVGQNVTIRLNLGAGGTRYFNGYVSHFTQLTAYGRLARYRATAVPWLWFLSRTADCRIFQEKTVPEIITQIFRDRGFTDFEDALSGSYRTWEYCVQYRETDFNFVSRLMEQEGIYYFFKHEDGKHSLVLADSASAHEPYPEFEELEYHPADKGTTTEECISDWVVETHLQPCSFALNDFDFKNPKGDLQARTKVNREHTAADFEIYDYPGEYTETSNGEEYTKKRIEELQAQYEVATASSDSRGICAGFTFSLTDHPRDDQNDEYLITSMEYNIEGGEFFSTGAGGGECAFSCSFKAIKSSQPFRSPRTTPKPKVSGPQTAIVVGPSGEEIYTDKYGRVKVKFHWDRYSKADENSSCWIRVAQVWAGKNWGAIYTPRIGQEIIIEFLEGDPDKPIITGRVYNGQAKPPYDLPGNKTMSTLKSNSTKGGEGFNEIRFEDKKGEEQIFIHAEKDQDTRVKNDCREYIGKECHLIVNDDQLEAVKGDKHSTVTGDRFAKTDGDQSFTVTGDQLVSISGDNHLTISGDQKEDIGGDQNLKAGMNLNTEAGMKVSVKAGTDLHEKAGLSYAVDASTTVHIKGGATVVIEGGAQVSLKAGPSFVDIGPTGVAISGPTVMINSGGAAGSGSGSSPTAPAKPESPTAPKQPKEAATEKPGEVAEAPKAPKPPEPTKFSPQATTLKDAANDGTPFCEECEKAKKEQAS
ncbi:MAG: type VI secretion system Vgr family protein [Planctomycetota bacterium]|jgi:type VI secretion system secreted protein VgrG